MAQVQRVTGDGHVSGNWSVGSITVRGGTPIGAERVEHRFAESSRQVGGTDVVARTEQIYIAESDGIVTAFSVFCNTPPSGSGVDKQYTVDLQKSTGGGAFATVLSAVVTISSADTARSVSSGTINSASYIAGDVFQTVVTPSGSTGSQGQGMAAQATFEESPS